MATLQRLTRKVQDIAYTFCSTTIIAILFTCFLSGLLLFVPVLLTAYLLFRITAFSINIISKIVQYAGGLRNRWLSLSIWDRLVAQYKRTSRNYEYRINRTIILTRSQRMQ